MSEFEQRRFVTRDGLGLAADVGGPADAPAVVLLHGGGQTRHSWSGAMRHLVGEGYFVVNLDSRGHGDSDWAPDGEYSLAALAADLEDVLATIDAPAALVGASMGGMTSFYAVGHAERPLARALVMVDIGLQAAPAGAEKIRRFMMANGDGFASLEEASEAVATYNPHRPRNRNPEGLLKNLRLRDDGRYYWHWDPRLIQTSPTPEPPDYIVALRQVSSRVTLPVLLIRGGFSDIVTDEEVAEMRRLVPQTEVFDVAGAGHMVAGDRNDAFNEGVLTFLRRHHPPHRDN
jgi:pimeloyl-ACP methyl ester carboxylesterase